MKNSSEVANVTTMKSLIPLRRQKREKRIYVSVKNVSISLVEWKGYEIELSLGRERFKHRQSRLAITAAVTQADT